jgi:hypothetical protein
MRQLLRLAVIGLIGIGVISPQPAAAVFSRTRLPLQGCRGFLAATGSVTYTKSYAETDMPDGEKLVITVNNVPLTPGTELLVYIHEKEVGSLKLDKRRSGRFEIKSSFRRLAPPITSGSFIVLMLDDGTKVMW